MTALSDALAKCSLPGSCCMVCGRAIKPRARANGRDADMAQTDTLQKGDVLLTQTMQCSNAAGCIERRNIS